MRNPFRYLNSSPEVIRLVVMMYIRYPLSLRQGEDILFERGMVRGRGGPVLVEPVRSDVCRGDQDKPDLTLGNDLTPCPEPCPSNRPRPAPLGDQKWPLVFGSFPCNQNRPGTGPYR